MFVASIASAQDTDQICQTTAINQAFTEAGLTQDREQLSNIQNQLMNAGYGELARDGIMGRATLQALMSLCLDFQVASADDLSARLIDLLKMTLEVAQKHDGWRELIRTDAFKTWLGQKPEPAQQIINNTLNTGPAAEVIAILDGYPPNKPGVSEKRSVTTKTVSKNGGSTMSGPAIFFRWQPDKEDESEDAQGTDTLQTADAQLPDDILNRLKAIEGVAYPNEFLFKRALATLFTEAECDLWCQNQILRQARNGPVAELKPIELIGADCGCSQDFSSLVYGFYPFWQADGEVQQVDFSLFDRMGFYALTLSQNGIIENPLQWSDTGSAAAFIDKAHKFRVEVDVTVYASGWQQWEDEDIRTAASSVAQVMIQEFHTSHTGLRAAFAFRDTAPSVTADGVTLYFDDYTASASSRQIVSFVSEVAKALDDAGSDTRLNIMLGLDMTTIEAEPLFEKLACILLDADESLSKQAACRQLDQKENNVAVDYVFAFLQEPTTKSKKILRRKIEDDFQGPQRKTVLRKVVPIISPAGHENDKRGPFVQFTDDLIYLQDNFAGVGLWPLPLADDASMKMIQEAITGLYKDTNGSNHLGNMIDTYAPWLCEFACPNRWLFRVSFDLLAGLLLLYALIAIWVCKLRSLYRRYFLYFLAAGLVAVLIFLISMVCDPFWQERADGVVLTVFLVALVATIWKYISTATQPPLP